MNTGNLFAGLRGATVSDRAPWLREGQYVIRVKRAIWKVTRTKGDAFILEVMVERSNYQTVKKKHLDTLGPTLVTPLVMADLEKILPNQEQTSASWYQSLKDREVGFGAVKGFAANILGVPSEDPKFLDEVEPFMQAVVQAGAINGMLIPVEVVTTKTKKGEDFSLHKWGQIIVPQQPQQSQPATG